MIELFLLALRDARVRHYPIGNEMPGEQAFDEAKRLRTGEQQFLGLLHFLLSLEFCFSHGKTSDRRRTNSGHEL